MTENDEACIAKLRLKPLKLNKVNACHGERFSDAVCCDRAASAAGHDETYDPRVSAGRAWPCTRTPETRSGNRRLRSDDIQPRSQSRSARRSNNVGRHGRRRFVRPGASATPLTCGGTFVLGRSRPHPLCKRRRRQTAGLPRTFTRGLHSARHHHRRWNRRTCARNRRGPSRNEAGGGR